MVLCALASAAFTSVAFPRLSAGAPHFWSRKNFVRFSLPGRPDHSLHLVLAATAWAALIASHSLGETTATRFFLRMTSAVGKRFLLTAPTDTRVETSVGGRTMRACSMPGRVTSQLHSVLPVTLSGMPGTGY